MSSWRPALLSPRYLTSVLKMYSVEPSEFYDLMESVTLKIQSIDDNSAKARLSSALTHLGISEGAWNLMPYISTAASLKQVAAHIKTALLITSRLLWSSR